MRSISRTELKTHLFSALKQVRDGEVIEVVATDIRSPGRPTKAIARIVPIEESGDESI